MEANNRDQIMDVGSMVEVVSAEAGDAPLHAIESLCMRFAGALYVLGAVETFLKAIPSAGIFREPMTQVNGTTLAMINRIAPAFLIPVLLSLVALNSACLKGEINVEALEGFVARSPNLKSLSDADVLSAMDDAIHDGVDILSLSLGPNPPQPNYFEDAVSVGAFHAFQKGILVSAFAGNSVFPRTTCNVAPWILTVVASTLDREFSSNIYLGNSKDLKGFSLNPTKMEYSHGLIHGSSAATSGVSVTNASFCKNNTLDPTLINGKIVICTIENFTDKREEKSIIVKQGGGVGMILIDHNAKEVIWKAKEYLNLYPSSANVKAEADIIDALTVKLPNLGVNVLPMQFTQIKDPMEIVKMEITNPTGAYFHVEELVEVARLLSLRSADDVPAVEEVIAREAAVSGDLQLASDLCLCFGQKRT
ncbi:hypothetical protein KIW84_014805 [Lathyrus oleraceus]|uniref:Uncharacterized protein n=1 Tax=Pisum sativum TaxID=3888 RepID=A0A9D5GZQ7_PEA|nr:hypothetical protein KIW84_014805 [Pisum sativum]